MTVRVQEVVPGEFDVDIEARRIRVLVPAGVGLPGVDDTDLAAAVVEELRGGDQPLPQVVDVSEVLTSRPGLLAVLTARFDDDPDDDRPGR